MMRRLALVLILLPALAASCAHDESSTHVIKSPPAQEPDVAQTSNPGRSYQLIDTTAAFFDFLDRHEKDDLDVQVEAFVTEVVEKNPKLYEAQVIGLPTDKPYDVALRERLRKFLPTVLPHVAAMRATHTHLAADLTRFETSFLNAFDDFSYSGRIYVMASAGGFDGATRQIDGQQALLFGIDGIATYHPPGSDLGPFFHHELFHLYHRQALEAEGVDLEAERNIAMALWGEGLAVYVSE